MPTPIQNRPLNKVLLKPRFSISWPEKKEQIIARFQKEAAIKPKPYHLKIIDHHIIIDISDKEQHFWSPQLHLEIEEQDNKSQIKGLFGPKPNVWSLFMFLHFAVALAFLVFVIIAYTRHTLGQDYLFASYMSVAMVSVWIILYFLGQIGKKKGHDQMLELEAYFNKILKMGSNPT